MNLNKSQSKNGLSNSSLKETSIDAFYVYQDRYGVITDTKFSYLPLQVAIGYLLVVHSVNPIESLSELYRNDLVSLEKLMEYRTLLMIILE